MQARTLYHQVRELYNASQNFNPQFQYSLPTRSCTTPSGVTRYLVRFLMWLLTSLTCHRIASSLSPEDPEIAFNHAAVLEASACNQSLYIHWTFIFMWNLRSWKAWGGSRIVQTQSTIRRGTCRSPHPQRKSALPDLCDTHIWIFFIGQRKNFGTKNEGCRSACRQVRGLMPEYVVPCRCVTQCEVLCSRHYCLPRHRWDKDLIIST